MVTSLQTQLAQRPPLSKVQAVEKEYNQLDLLYHSTQRENQACMAEIEKGKRRERILEGELAKLVGDGWMVRSSCCWIALAVSSVKNNSLEVWANVVMMATFLICRSISA